MFTLKTYFQKKLNINTDDDHDSQEYDNNDIIAVASSNMLLQQIHNCKAIYIQEEKKKKPTPDSCKPLKRYTRWQQRENENKF